MLPDPQEVSSLAKDPEGRLYAGTSKGLYIFGGDRILGHYPFSETDHDGIPGNQIRNIYPTGNYTCWIATNQGLVQLKTGQKQVYRQQPDKPYGLLSNDITVIAPGPDQQLWVGTDRGLCLFNPKSQRFTDMSRPGNDCLTSRLASCLAADSRGDIWIGTSENGLNRLSLEADTLTHFYHEAWNPFSLPDNEITSICCGNHGSLGRHSPGSRPIPQKTGTVPALWNDGPVPDQRNTGRPAIAVVDEHPQRTAAGRFLRHDYTEIL